MAVSLIVLVSLAALVRATMPRREPESELPGWAWRKIARLPVVRR